MTGLVLGYLIIPLVCFRTEEHRRKIYTRWLIHKSFRLLTRLMSMLGVIAFDIADAEETLAGHHGKVVVANHPSLIDVVVLISVMPHADCIIKQELASNVFIRSVLKNAAYITNGGDMENLINACDKSLREGHSLIIFPEGTRTTPGRPLSLQRGASNIALRCKADLVPVLIRCEPTTLTKHEKWYSIPSRKVRFSLRVQQPIAIAACDAPEKSMPAKARHLTAKLQDYFTESLRCYG